jgi:hypothetical protein
MGRRPSQQSRWLLLVFRLPSKNGSGRVDIWRKLRRAGALALPTSGYLLPNTADNLERLEWLSAEIRKYKGQATVAQVESFDDMPQERIVQLFVAERNKDYESLLRQLQRRRSRQRIVGVRQKLFQISTIDFFGSPLKVKVEHALAAMEREISGPRIRSARRQYSNRLWVTRHRPGIDRCASAWLIQRFIDPRAKFTFAQDSKQQPEAIPFDMYGNSGFGHRGDSCTFEMLCLEFGLRDGRLRQISEIVHDADLDDGKFQRAEGAGIDRILKGWARQQVSDHELLRRGMALFEGLYEGLQ